VLRSQNQQALQFEYDAVNANHIAPKAVTGWKEGDVQQAFTSGQAAFSTNWPFVFAASKGSPTEGKIGFAPFLGKGATLGIENLAVNAKTEHAAAAWKCRRGCRCHHAARRSTRATGSTPDRLRPHRRSHQMSEVSGLASRHAGRSPGHPGDVLSFCQGSERWIGRRS